MSKTALVLSNDKIFSQKIADDYLKSKLKDFTIKTATHYEFLEHFDEKPADILFVDCSEMGENVFSSIRKVTRASGFPKTPLVCVGNFKDVQTVLRLNALGVSYFLNLPIKDEELSSVLDRALSGASGEPSGQSESKIVTVFSPKGGTGVTLLTANLAVSMVKNHGFKVVVCDLANQCGSIASYLNMVPRYTIRDIVDQHDLLDASYLQGIMHRHESGLHILSGPKENQGPLTADHIHVLKSIFQLLKESYDFILIDGGNMRHELIQAIFNESNTIVLTGNLDMASLKGLVSTYNKLRGMHYSPSQIKVLINRYNAKNQIDIKEFEKKTQHAVACRVPNQYALCVEAINTGQPLSYIDEQSSVVSQIDSMARLITNADESAGAGKGLAATAESIFESMKKGLLSLHKDNQSKNEIKKTRRVRSAK